MQRLRSLVVLSLSVLLWSSVALAQRDLGTVTGTVTDPQGSAVPNARVTITEDATGLVYVVQTNDAGEYVRPALKPGIYSVIAEAQGFRRVEQKNIVINGGDRVGVPLTVAVGDVNQTIEVSAQAPLLQTESTTLGADLSSKDVSQLPLGAQRTFTFLARLTPGVVSG